MSFGQQMLMGLPEYFRSLGNAAVGGRDSATIVANLETDVPSTARVVVYHEGTNDAQKVAPLSVAEHMANVKAIYDWCVARGILLVIVESATGDTGNGGAPHFTATSVARIEQYAFAERIFCEERGIPFVSPWWTWIDTADGTWTSAAGVTDALHPPQAVHDEVATQIISQMRARRPAVLMPRQNSGAAGLFGSNVLNLTGSGLTGWNTQSQAPSSSAVSAGSGSVRGNWADQTFTSVTSSGKIYRQISLSNISAGERVRIAGFFKFTNTSNMRLACRLQFQRSSGGNVSQYLFDTSTSFAEKFIEADIVAPDNLSNVYLWLEYQAINGGSNAYSGTFSNCAYTHLGTSNSKMDLMV